MDGARYLEDGKLTIFMRSGTCYARIRIAMASIVSDEALNKRS